MQAAFVIDYIYARICRAWQRGLPLPVHKVESRIVGLPRNGGHPHPRRGFEASGVRAISFPADHDGFRSGDRR